MSRRVALYCRLSVTREESVSIARQLEAGRLFAAARGWTIVAEHTDDGLSATRTRPEDRPGWQALLAEPARYEAVIVLKVDRLARRVLDFLHADEALRRRGAGLVAVEDPIDMTTPQGQAFATILAVFGQMEAAAISARVKAARDHLIRDGRVVGGTVPYGWQSVPNPGGAGFVLAQDPDRIEWVRGMVERALAGATIYAVQQWLNAEGAPLPEKSQKARKGAGWAYSTVERLLRNPVLAGMTPYAPGRDRHAAADPAAVLRDERGLPVVDESVAIISAVERDRLLALLDGRSSAQSRPRASKGATSPLLSGLVTCGHCQRRMHRGTTQGRPSLSCPDCGQVISTARLTEYLTARLLEERGHLFVLASTTVGQDPADLVAVEAAIRDLSARIGEDGADVPTLVAQIEALKADRAEARQSTPRHSYKVTGKTVRKAWELSNDDLARRDVLAGQLASLCIVRGKVGRYLDPARVELTWRPTTKAGGLVEVAVPDDASR